MNWWQWVFIVLLVGAVGILSKFVWNRFGTTTEGFLTLSQLLYLGLLGQPTSIFGTPPEAPPPPPPPPMPQWNGVNLLQSSVYTVAATGGFSRYTIFDMERVEVQRKILEYEFGLLRQIIWAHETAYIDWVKNNTVGPTVFNQFLRTTRMFTGPATGLSDNDTIQTMRILFSYLYIFTGENPYEFAYRGYKGFDRSREDTVNLVVNTKPTNVFTVGNISAWDFDLTGFDTYVTSGMKQNIEKEFDLDALRHPIGYLLIGKKSAENRYPPGSAPILWTNLPVAIIAAGLRDYEKFSIMKQIWACPSTAKYGKPASRIVDAFINHHTDHGYFLTFCSYNPDQWDGFEFHKAYHKDATLAGFSNPDAHQAAVRKKLTGGQVQQRGFNNHFIGYATWLWRDTSSFDIYQVPDENIFGYNIQYPSRFKEGAYIGTNILSDPVNWNETGLPKSIFKYGENGVSNTYVNTLITNFAASKGNTKANYPWRGVDVSGVITQANIDEITKSISVSLPLNFSDPITAEQQMRIAPDERFYISPTFNAKPEYANRITDVNGVSTMVLVRDDGAVGHNNTNCNMAVTSEMLGLIPYHARRFMMNWGDARAERIKKFNAGTFQGGTDPQDKFDSTVKTVSNIYVRPTFDLASAGNPSLPNVLSVEGKQAILNSMAQLYYDKNEGKRRINVFQDVFQVGETIFDARYKIHEKTSSTVQAQISSLTAEYESIRNGTLTIDEANRLELSYQQKLSELYEAEEQNIENTGTNCAPKVKFIRIQSAETGKRICLSQVRASNNEGRNVAMFGIVTTLSTTNTKLFPGEEATGTQVGYDGRIMSQDRSDKFNAAKNKAAKDVKLQLLTDGVQRPRTVPNYYESVSTDANDFVLVNIGYEEEITNVELILPQILPEDAAKSFRIKVFKDSVSQVGREQTATLDLTDPTRRATDASFLYSNYDSKCAVKIADTFRVARFYATIDGTGRGADGRPDITKIRFTGFSESRRLDTAVALSFNPLYNCGFDFPIDEDGGGQVWRPRITYTQNFRQLADVNVNCADAATAKNILTEYRLSQRGQGFDSRPDVVALPEAKSYKFMENNYTPSTATAYAQINPSTCAYTFQEIVADVATNQFKGIVERTGMFNLKPDTENWFSKRLVYNTPSSLMFATPADYNARFPANPLVPFGAPIAMPIPIQPKVRLDDANGACPEKYCSDMDVINQLILQYNNIEAGAQTRTRQILRVNRAVSGGGLAGSTKRCDYEAVFGIYGTAAATPETTFTSTIAMFTEVQPNENCKYKLKTVSEPGYGHFADANQPLLTKIYTYATETITPYYKDLMAAVTSLLSQGEAQTAETGTNITTGLRTYRADVLASYAALKQLDGCPPTETNNRCNSEMITRGFIQNYQLNNSSDEYIKQVLRAGTASGSECDFTFETNTGTRGARCRMAKVPNYCAFAFSTVYKPAEVFAISTLSDGLDFQKAFDTCRVLGAELATTNQVNNALRFGADWCATPGFVLDSGPDGAPQAVSPCQSLGSLSTVRLGPLSTIGTANCYGLRPATGGTVARLLPYSPTSAVAPVSQFIPGCIETIPVPPTINDLADLGYKPNMVTSASVAASTSMSTIQIPAVAADVISPRDFVDCASAYAVATADSANPTIFAPFYTAATQSVEAIDAKTCLYNSTIQATFLKRQGGVYETPIVQTVSRRTVNAANVRTIVPTYTVRPTTTGISIATDADCSGAAMLAASGLRSVVVDARRYKANICEYRVAKSEILPFGETFRQVFFGGAAGAPYALSIGRSNEGISRFRFTPSMATLIGTGGAAALAPLVKLFRDFWNAKFYDTTVPTDTVFRKRVGNVRQIGYSIEGDSFYFIAQYAEYGPLGDLDIRTFSETQCFRVVFRKPHATFFSADLTGAFVFSADPVTPTPALTFTSFQDDIGPTLVSAQDTLRNNSLFRAVRFKNTGTTPVELYRMNFYEVANSSPGPFKCDLQQKNPLINTIQPTRAYVTVTEITKPRDLRLKSYLLPEARICEPEYDQVTDPVSLLEKCVLNINKIVAEDRKLYKYNTVDRKPCQIGYSQTPGTMECNLNYDFNALLQPYCFANASTQSPRLELAPQQSVMIYFNDTFQVNGFTITTGSARKLPTQWQLDGSINGSIWANLHTQSAAYQFVDTTANPPGQFVTSQLILWKTGGLISTDPMVSRPLGTTGVVEPFIAQPQPQATAVQRGKPRPSWFRIRVLSTAGPSKFVSMGGPLLFLTPSGYIDPAQIQVTNFGGSRKDPREGPGALLTTQVGSACWTDYNRAPLIFRLPTEREPIRGFRYGAVPTAAALPKDWVLEGSWDGRAWSPIGEVPTPDRLVVRFEQPF
jgi:hypothetical protein